MDKIKVSQDLLYKYLQEHNVTKVIIAKKMGVSESIVGGCFRHALNRHGKPLSFSKANLVKLNDAIQQIADDLRNCVITFGSDQTFTNMRGTTYDPGVLKTIHEIGNYFVLNHLMARLLGWSKSRCCMVVSVKSSSVYGNVTEEDVNRINTELLSVAGVLDDIEVVPDENTSDDIGNIKPSEIKVNNKGTCARTNQNFERKVRSWGDTSLTLKDRAALFRKQNPDSILLFYTDGGYTAEGVDAAYIHDLCEDIIPYKNVESGMITAWIDSEKATQLLTRMIADGHKVTMTV